MVVVALVAAAAVVVELAVAAAVVELVAVAAAVVVAVAPQVSAVELPVLQPAKEKKLQFSQVALN